MNRNKASLAVDLKTSSGVEIVQALARTADVLIHNYRPGVMERLGLGYERLAEADHGSSTPALWPTAKQAPSPHGPGRIWSPSP